MAEDVLKNDLKLTRRSFDDQVADRDSVDLIVSAGDDLQPVSGRGNLGQAIINRLFTRKGELKGLGHPDYGSRLHLLIGELNNARTRGLAELYIREALNAEPRIKEIVGVKFAPPAHGDGRDRLAVTISVQPIDAGQPMTVTIPFNLGG